ncbi:hypothetical protein GGI02_005922, partial [Coemansia sp. RSA 2322]
PGVTLAASAVLAWQVVSIAAGFRSVWVLYSVWMAVSGCALFYGQRSGDVSHVRWFAMALFVDIFVYIGYMWYDPEFAMTDVERCAVAMRTNRELTMEHCLAHVHEIKNIAYIMRVAAVLAKFYLAGLARSYELAMPTTLAAHTRRAPASAARVQ